jgi:hypothetical protein
MILNISLRNRAFPKSIGGLNSKSEGSIPAGTPQQNPGFSSVGFALPHESAASRTFP